VAALSTGYRPPLAPRSGLERSDFVLWHISADQLDTLTFRKGSEADIAGVLSSC
jgi:hypothetical protein